MKERLDQSGNEVTELVTRTSVSLNRMASPRESSLNPTAEEFFPSPVEVKVTATLHYLFSTTAHRSTRPSSPPGPASSGPCSSLGCRRLWRERLSSRMLMRRLFRRFFTTSTRENSPGRISASTLSSTWKKIPARHQHPQRPDSRRNQEDQTEGGGACRGFHLLRDVREGGSLHGRHGEVEEEQGDDGWPHVWGDVDQTAKVAHQDYEKEVKK